MVMNIHDALNLGIDELERQKAEMETQEDFDRGQYNIITNALNQLKAEQDNAQEVEARKAKQEEHMEGLLGAVFELGLFEAIEPAPDKGERLHEYDERRREFYHILHDFVREQQQKLIDTHNAEIDGWYAKVQEASKQAIETQEKLDDANIRIEEVEREADEYQQDALKAMKDLQALDETISQLRSQLAAKDQQIAKLNAEIADLKRAKPTEYQAPSSSITERVSSLAAKSRNPFEMADDFFRRNGLPLPSIGKKTDTSETGAVNELETVVEGADGPVDSFRVGDDSPAMEGVQQEAEPGDHRNEQPAVGTLEEAFKRIEALEREVFKDLQKSA